MTDIVVYYHNDSDGRMSAAIVAKHLRERLGTEFNETIHLEEVSYGMRPNRFMCRSAEVWVVDFSFSKEDMLELAHIAEKLIWIDHHKTVLDWHHEVAVAAGKASKEAKGIIDMDHAACELVWKYCNPDLEMPLSIKYVADRDMWRWKLKGTAEFEESLRLLSKTPPSHVSWQSLLMEGNSVGCMALVSQGARLVAAKKMRVDDRAQKTHVVQWEGFKTAFVNATCDWSEVGHEILNGVGIEVAAVYRIVGITAHVELRSEGPDVSLVAQKYQGGGHPKAAGFIIRADILLGWFE